MTQIAFVVCDDCSLPTTRFRKIHGRFLCRHCYVKYAVEHSEFMYQQNVDCVAREKCKMLRRQSVLEGYYKAVGIRYEGEIAYVHVDPIDHKRRNEEKCRRFAEVFGRSGGTFKGS